MTASGVRDITSLTSKASWTRVSGGQADIFARSQLFGGYSINIFFPFFLGSLIVGMRLWSCALVMLLPLGAKALPQTNSALANFS